MAKDYNKPLTKEEFKKIQNKLPGSSPYLPGKSPFKKTSKKLGKIAGKLTPLDKQTYIDHIKSIADPVRRNKEIKRINKINIKYGWSLPINLA